MLQSDYMYLYIHPKQIKIPQRETEKNKTKSFTTATKLQDA